MGLLSKQWVRELAINLLEGVIAYLKNYKPVENINVVETEKEA